MSSLSNSVGNYVTSMADYKAERELTEISEIVESDVLIILLGSRFTWFGLDFADKTRAM